MKVLEFKTSKGEFLLVDMDFNNVLDKYKGLKFTFMYPLKHISELESSEIVDYFIEYSKRYQDYERLECAYLTAIESLHSLLKSKSVHLFENPVPKPYNYDLWAKYGDFTQYGKTLTIDCLRWKESEQKTFYNPYIFKL